MALGRALAKRVADISLRAKITAVTVFILFLGLFVAGVGTLSLLQPQLIRGLDADLTQLRTDPGPALASGANTTALSRDDVLYASNQYYVAVLDADGSLQYDNSRSNESITQPKVPELPMQWVEENRDQVRPLKTSDGVEWRFVTAPILNIDGDASGSLLIAVSTASVNQVMAQYIIIFSGFGIGVILLGAALTRILVTTTFLPLAEVEQTALEISRGDYSKRIMVSNPRTEVGYLGQSLNLMLDRLDGSLEDRAHTIEQMRRFVGDAGHELRTPLVSVRGYAELYRMGALQDEEAVSMAFERIEKEAIRMTSLVEDLLSLARLDERRPLELTSLDLNSLVRDAALDAGVRAPDRAVTAIEDEASPVVVGDEHKVRQVLTNLLGNAMRHTPEGSPIEIRAIALPGTGMARFEIIDHGDGIPEQIREKIFGRFWRADSSRNRETGGSGLGLAIVASIVDAHKGTVTVHDTPGGGATFRIDLPGPAAQPAELAADTVEIQRLPRGKRTTA